MIERVLDKVDEKLAKKLRVAQHYNPGRDHPRTSPTLEPVIAGRLRDQRIIDGWPDILQLVGSIRADIVLPSHVITKRAANPRQSSLARVLIERGRLEHT